MLNQPSAPKIPGKHPKNSPGKMPRKSGYLCLVFSGCLLGVPELRAGGMFSVFFVEILGSGHLRSSAGSGRSNIGTNRYWLIWGDFFKILAIFMHQGVHIAGASNVFPLTSLEEESAMFYSGRALENTIWR